MKSTSNLALLFTTKIVVFLFLINSCLSDATGKNSVGKSSITEENKELTIWFDQPGKDWESESLPIGNGALGATVLGGVEKDIIQFSEKTLWTGGPIANDINAEYDFGLPEERGVYVAKLKQVQQQLAKKGNLKPKDVVKELGRDNPSYGSFQSFADIVLKFNHNTFDETQTNNNISHYRRSLDISTAIAKVEYQQAGVNYTREYFVSYPEQVIVIRLTADKPAQINLITGLDIPHNRFASKMLNNGLITVRGALHDNKLAYETQLKISINGGELTSTKNNEYQIKNADEAWLVIAAATNYEAKFPHYRGAIPNKIVTTRIKAAIRLGHQQLRERHLVDYQNLFSRVTLNVGQKMPNTPTNKLLERYKNGVDITNMERRSLEHLYYQFGRYLLVSSSRQGSLPANLQGVWNKHEYAPWSADYHVNINLQMNYWLADMTNLSETNEPLFDFIDSLIEPGTLTAKRLFNAKGWTLFLNTNIWGFTGLIAWPTAFWQPEAGAWLSRHYYQHYLFTQDKQFLAERAYPVMKGAAEFWLDVLVFDNKSNQFVVSPSYSPEHGDFTVGAAMSQQIVYDLFFNTRNAALLLADDEMVSKLDGKISKLDKGLHIGLWGQLQEWHDDLDDKKSQHRHVSHLYALHPANQISPITTPKLANAAKVSLNARGDGGTGWSKAWKINFWARLFDGNRAHKLLSEQLIHSTLPNLWDNHPPFQIDGNFGATAGITEMLLQSQNQEVHLLPALPDEWKNGEVKGLKARGNILVNIKWLAGKLENAELISSIAQTINVRNIEFNKNTKILNKGDEIEFSYLHSVLIFNAKAEAKYQIIL